MWKHEHEQINGYKHIENEQPANIVFEQLRFLIVDDNDNFIKLHKTILLKAGALLVDHANNGEDAIAKFSKSEIGYYNIILTDIIMPDMSGYVLARGIRNLQRNDALMVTIITLSCNDVNSLDYADCVDDSLEKPLNVSNVIKCLRKYLRV